MIRKANPTTSPNAMNEPARDVAQIIEPALALLKDSPRRMAEDLAAYRRHREQVRQNIERGIRKTDGRIVGEI